MDANEIIKMEEDFKCIDEMPAIMFNCHPSPFSGSELPGRSLNYGNDKILVKTEPLSPGDAQPEPIEGSELPGRSLNYGNDKILVKTEPLSSGDTQPEPIEGGFQLKADEEETEMMNFNVKEENKNGLPGDSNISSRKCYQCNHCDLMCITREDMKKHLKTTHSKDHNEFKCAYCAFTTFWKHSLKQHIDSVHLKLRLFKCPNCDHASSKKSDLFGLV